MWCNYLSRLIKPTIKDSDVPLPTQINRKMKISIFYKSYTIKASFMFLLILLTTSTPIQAQAGFFEDFAKNLTTKVFGEEIETLGSLENGETSSSMDNNSQTIPLLESSINPDMKNAENEKDIIIDNNEALMPTEGPLSIDVEFEKSPISDKIYVYTVKEGDTLSEIAENFDVSENTIRWENNISGQKISIGQKLNILPVTGVKHIVKKGDTMSKIATKYEAESEDIYIYNGISASDGLKQGDILFVPNGIIKVVVAQKISTTGSKTYTATNSSNAKIPSGFFIKPVSGIVTSPYGSRKGGFHYGIDYGNSRGTPVMAAASGVIIKVVSNCVEGKTSCGGRYGNYVVIAHSNGLVSRYAHLSSASVHVGQEVKQGQKIGGLGNTGRSTGPHLHFQVENSSGSTIRPAF